MMYSGRRATMSLYLPASGGTPLVGKLPYGSTDVRNLHEEMCVFSLGVISFISFIKKMKV